MKLLFVALFAIVFAAFVLGSPVQDNEETGVAAKPEAASYDGIIQLISKKGSKGGKKGCKKGGKKGGKKGHLKGHSKGGKKGSKKGHSKGHKKSHKG